MRVPHRRHGFPRLPYTHVCLPGRVSPVVTRMRRDLLTLMVRKDRSTIASRFPREMCRRFRVNTS